MLTEHLVNALSHPSRIIAIAAAKLLASRPDGKTAKLAEEVLQYGNDQAIDDEDPEVRNQVVKSLRILNFAPGENG
ncbi:hypothetical protein [Desulfoscipio gibsoniae]|uniref:hypothetical protein n=1 Tax=Desulfoscipio gibsoniae TaxID=102134 RepID=UPI0003120563|nr:hypothetical protein [Desulfoscipio gibsoniae]